MRCPKCRSDDVVSGPMTWQAGTRDRLGPDIGGRPSALGLPLVHGATGDGYSLPLSARFAPHSGPKAWAALVSFTVGAFIVCGVVPSVLHVGSIRIFAALFGVTLFVVRAISRNAVTTEPTAQRGLAQDCSQCRQRREGAAMTRPPAKP